MATGGSLAGSAAVSAQKSSWVLLRNVPHRFFFLAAVAQLSLVSLWWLWVLGARALGPQFAPSSAMPDTIVHAFIMLYGFAPLLMFGFLFTAGPRWLGVATPPAAQWNPPGLLAVAGALSVVPVQVFAPAAWALQLAAATFALGWAWLLFLFLRLIRQSSMPDKVHAIAIFSALSAGVCGVVLFALQGSAGFTWFRIVGLWFFLLPAFVVVCHRMIPFFTASVLPLVTAFRPWWLLAMMAGAPVAHGGLEAAGLSAWTWIVDLPTAMILLWVVARWGLVESLANRLLAMLHIGFTWYALGFLLFAAHSLALLLELSTTHLAPLHALTMGFAASLVMAMVTRVTCGHAGRTLAADTVTWRLFLLLQVAAVARVALATVAAPAVIAAVALIWAVAVVPWCVRYAPVYWRPRADGRPG